MAREKDNSVAIVALVVIFAALIYTSNYNPGAIIQQPPANGTQQPSAPSVDLRNVAAPYLAVTDVQTTCQANDGNWHYAQDWVGCEGAGTLYCNTAVITAAQQQCIGAGANWVCDPNNVYCKLG